MQDPICPSVDNCSVTIVFCTVVMYVNVFFFICFSFFKELFCLIVSVIKYIFAEKLEVGKNV